MADRPSVFVDANVLASALYSARGAPRQLLDLSMAGSIQLVVPEQVLREFTRAVRLKLPAALPQLYDFFATQPLEVAPDPSEAQVQILAPTINASDAYIIAAAHLSEADLFVTGDHRLLRELGTMSMTFKAVTPREFVEGFTR